MPSAATDRPKPGVMAETLSRLKDGVSANGISRISALQLQSAAGLFMTDNSTFNGPTDVLSPTSMSGANFAASGYPDNMDLGLVLPAGLLLTQLTADLTVKYQIFGQGAIRLGDVYVVPEPTGVVLAALGAARLLARRRKRSRA